MSCSYRQVAACTESLHLEAPLTLALSQRERGLIGEYLGITPTWQIGAESIIDSIFQVDV
jgi:hypothetical protein